MIFVYVCHLQYVHQPRKMRSRSASEPSGDEEWYAAERHEREERAAETR